MRHQLLPPEGAGLRAGALAGAWLVGMRVVAPAAIALMFGSQLG